MKEFGTRSEAPDEPRRPAAATRSVILAAVVALALAPAARGEDPSVWLDRMAVFYERVVFATDFVLTAGFHGLTIQATGKILYRDEGRQRMDARLEVNFPGLGSSLSGSLEEVRDGTYLWVEVAVGPEVEVFKERLQEGAAARAGRFSEPGRSMNPISELPFVREYAAFDAVEKTATMVLLQGRLLPRALEEGAVTDLLGPEPEIRLGLRRKDAAPLLLTLGPPGGPPSATLRLRNIRRLSADQLPAGAFSYRPPPDADLQEH